MQCLHLRPQWTKLKEGHVRYVLPVLYVLSNFAAAGGIVLYAPTSDESPNPVLPVAKVLRASPPVLCVMHDEAYCAWKSMVGKGVF